MTALRERLAAMVQRSTGGQVSADDVLAGQATLTALGLDSLGHLRLIDAIEAEFGVETDLVDGGRRLDTLDDLARHLIANGVPAGS